MGTHENITGSRFPRQSDALGKRTSVCFHHDTKDVSLGTVVRDDVESPFETLVRLDNGRVVRGTECQYTPPAGAATPREALRLAEVAYLVANGWSVGEDEDHWHEPKGRRGRVLRHGHAVNSQKLRDDAKVARDHCTRCREHYDNCACDD